MSRHETKKKLKKGIFWGVVGTLLSKMFIMIASIITSRLLGVDKNGEFGIINNTVVMFSTFATLGLGTTATKFIAELKFKEKEKCGNIISMTNMIALFTGLVMSIILFFSSEWLAIYTLNNPNVTIGLRISSILLFFNTINTVQISTLAGFEDFKGIAKLTTMQGILSLPIFFSTTLLWGVEGLVFGYGIVALVCCILYRIVISQQLKKHNIIFNYSSCLKEYKILFQFSLPSMLSNVMVGPVTWLGNTIIINTVGGYTALGLFNAAFQWRTAIMLIPSAIGNVILSTIISSQEDEKLEFLNMSLSFYIVVLICIPIILFPDLIGVLYGVQYAGSSFNVTLIFIALTCCLLAYKEGISRNLISRNLMWFGFLSNALWAISFLIFMVLLKEYGSIGISLTYFLSYLISTVIFVPFYIRKKAAKKSFFYSAKINLLWILLGTSAIVSCLDVNIIIKLILLLILIVSWLHNVNDLINIKNFIDLIRNRRS